MNELWVLAAALMTGVLSGLGPCCVPRYAAMFALASGAPPKRRAPLLAVFLIGSAAAYAAALAALGAALRVAASRELYWALALACAAIGISAIFFNRICDRERPRRPHRGPAFLAGFVTALLGTPCCLPVLALMSEQTSAAAVAAASTAFVMGQTLPGAAVAACLRTLGYRVHRARDAQTAGATVCAGLTFFLSGYYALLA